MGYIYCDSSVDSLYNDMLLCTEDMCRMGVHCWNYLLLLLYIIWGGVKNFMF